MSPSPKELSRRKILSAGAAVAASHVACTEATSATPTGTAGGGDGSGGTSSMSGGMGGQGGNGQGGVGQGAGPAGGGGAGGGPGNLCSLTPQQTAGPFYLDDDLVRQDITEGKIGSGLRVVIDVVALPDCTAVTETPVDIWHCDAAGVYSGFTGQLGGLDTTGETFLRGTQITDAAGQVEFHSIYPGWYPGRAVHIHFTVHLAGNLEITSQLYFPDGINDTVMALSPYDEHTPFTGTNADDGFFSGTANSATLVAEVVAEGDGYLAKLTIGVQSG